MRSDAQKNLKKLLKAASAAFETSGANAALDDIARRAGVSIATLYRHFPTRQDLVEALYLTVADTLRDEGQALLNSADPWTALLTWLRSQLERGAFGRGLAASVMSAKLQEGSSVHTASRQMKDAGQALLDRAVAAGVARAGVDIGDLLMVVHGIVLVNEQIKITPNRAEAMLNIVLSGVRR